jgi:hypothetical protein
MATGRDLLEHLLRLDPADLELEVVTRHWDDAANDYEYVADVPVSVKEVTRLDIPLLGSGKGRNEVFRVLTLG